MIPKKALVDALELPKKAVISIIGGGGKTSLMYYLGHELSDNGKLVIAGTTTNILAPLPYQAPLYINPSKEDTAEALKQHGFIVASRKKESGKLGYPLSLNFSNWCHELADYVLIEADGSKHLPIKVPSASEPVIPQNCKVIIGIIGIDAFGMPIDKVCHRSRLAAEILGVPSLHPLTAWDISKLILSQDGYQKYVTESILFRLVINKCDNTRCLEEAQLIAQSVRKRGGNFPIIATTLKTKMGAIVL